MKYDVVVSREAGQQLVDCLYFVAEASMEAAESLRGTVSAALQSLGEMPQRCPFFNEPYLPQNKYRKMVVAKRYLLLFQIKESTVYVEYVLDCRRDYRWLIGQ